jgi:hypothetical protein
LQKSINGKKIENYGADKALRFGLEKYGDIMGHSSALNRGFDVGRYQEYKNYGKGQGLAADAFVILKENLDVRIRIEAFLSRIFASRQLCPTSETLAK